MPRKSAISCRVAQVGAGVAQLLHRGTAIEAAGAVDLQPVGEKVQLHRGALGVDVV